MSKVFDLKGSLRGRYAKHLSKKKEKSDRSNLSPSPTPKKRNTLYGSDNELSSDEDGDNSPPYTGSDEEDEQPNGESKPSASTLLDGDFLEFTAGRPLALTDRANATFHMSIFNVRD